MVNIKKMLSIFLVFTVVISVLFIGKVFASSNIIKLTNIQIKDQTSGVDASIDSYNSNTVNTSNDYYKVNNYVEYILTIKNVDSKPYSIKSISDDNTNPNITYDYYEYKDKILKPNTEVNILIRETYNTANGDLNNRTLSNSVKFLFNLVDEDGVEIYTDGDNPTTGDKIMFYVTIFGLSIIALTVIILAIIKTKKGKKLPIIILIALAFIPGLVKADDVEATITFNNNIELHDKVKVTFNYNGISKSSIIDYDSSISEPRTPNRNGYIFLGWYKNNNPFDFSSKITEDTTLEANYLKESYTITYDLDGGNASNPGVYRIDELPITLDNPVKEGYTFNGWTGSNGNIPQKNLTITNENQDLNYKANYTINTYTIAYEGLTEEEITSLGNPNTFTINDTITLNNPSNRFDGDGDLSYKFIGWKTDTNDVSKVITFANETSSKSFEAVWLPVAPDTYSITYVLNGGSVDGTNPISFTKLTPSFTLINPTRRGYSFDGWIGSNGNVPQTSVTVNQGTKQDLEFEAVFTKISYPINYTLNGGTITGTNPNSYTVTDTVTLINPTKRGYNFLGWSGTDIEGTSTNVTIPVNSIGERSYTANFEAIEYTINYDLDGGTANNPLTYTVNDTITLTAPTKDGYVFLGWTGSNGQTPQTTVTITDSIGNLSYTANYSANPYYIHYDKNLTKAKGTMTDQTMAVGQAANLNKNQFYAIGYEFDGWTLNNAGTGTVYLDEESVTSLALSGTVTLYAKWRSVSYAIIDKGENFNAKIKQLSGQSGARTGTTNSIIRYVRYSDTIPDYVSQNPSDYLISAASSPSDVYVWFDSSTATIYYGSPAEVIYTNSNPSYMYANLYTVIEIENHYKTDGSTDMTQMYYGCHSLTTNDTSDFNTSEVTNMYSMFGENLAMTSYNLNSWNVEKVSSFKFMFNQNTTLLSLDLKGWNTKSATNMQNMFSSMYSLKSLDISTFNTSKVTIFDKMFDNQRAMVSLDLSNFDTSSATSMFKMFYNMYALQSLNITSFNTSKVTNMQEMFIGTRTIEVLDLSSFDTSKVTKFSNMFNNCTGLKTILVSDGFTTSALTTTPIMFDGATSLVGGAGTTYSSSHKNSTYAHIDGEGGPGYFTRKQ